MTIHVFVAFYQAKNPGPAGLAVIGLVDGRPAVRTRYLLSPVTNHNAAWLLLGFALERLAGRKAIIWTNYAAVTGPVRETPAGCSYGAAIDQVRANLGESEIRHLADACASKWLEEAKAAARVAFQQALVLPPNNEAGA